MEAYRGMSYALDHDVASEGAGVEILGDFTGLAHEISNWTRPMVHLGFCDGIHVRIKIEFISVLRVPNVM